MKRVKRERDRKARESGANKSSELRQMDGKDSGRMPPVGLL